MRIIPEAAVAGLCLIDYLQSRRAQRRQSAVQPGEAELLRLGSRPAQSSPKPRYPAEPLQHHLARVDDAADGGLLRRFCMSHSGLADHGVSDEELAAFSIAHNVCLPADLRAFYRVSNGTKSMSHVTYISILPLHELTVESDRIGLLPSQRVLVFGEWMIWSEMYELIFGEQPDRTDPCVFWPLLQGVSPGRAVVLVIYGAVDGELPCALGPLMNLEQAVVKGRDYARTVWFSPGPTNASHALCIFMDGEFYLERMGAASVLEGAIATGRLPPLSFAFVSHNGSQSRHEDYVCNDRFARYVAEELASWAKAQLDSIRAERNVICGLSLSGLASAHAALAFPHVFSSSLSQSGSFWWNRNRFASLARENPRTGSRHWLSVGDEEIEENATHPPTGMRQEFSQVAGVQSAVDALKSGGAEVMHHVFHGGHAFEPWRDELSRALHWLVGSELRP